VIKTALVNGTVYTGDAVLRGQAVLTENGKIKGFSAVNLVPEGWRTVDLGGQIIAHGFIDVQVNGGGGVLFTDDPTPEALKGIARAHERFGTLHWCPAILSSDTGTAEQCLNAVRTAMDQNIGVLGAHLEGPFLSLEKRGAHDERFIRPANEPDVTRLLEAGRGALSLVTLAPEAAGETVMARFIQAGARVFLGHTNAPCHAAEAAFASGASGVTHLYNAMSQLTGREPGVVGAAFAAKDIWAGIIADGVHTDWRSVEIAKRIKQNRLFLVTDAMPPAGKPEAVYKVGGKTAACIDGRCETEDGVLAGSALDMASAVRNCVAHCGIALDEALRMASAYPAEMLGLGGRLGYIRPGYPADLVFLDGGLNVAGVMRGGVIKEV
jgi:N-acetylglucosamine-6-phosphate deacetylase